MPLVEEKKTYWTPETRDALTLAAAVAELLEERNLRRMSVIFDKGALRVTVEARR